MQRTYKRHLPALACSGVFLVCEWISRPWVERGMADDWSYIRTVQLLVQTGHIYYNGWATAMVGWQLYLSAACIKLFGFSFTAARVPTFIIALITTYLMQRTLVRFGISERNAVLGTLTFVLSPLFMMVSPTMMTDIPGFFSILTCLYACVRALQALRDRNAILWLCLAVAVNAICGTSRQIAWLGVLVLVPCTLFLLRSRRVVLLSGIAATALGFLFVYSTLHWFNTQPYALPEPLNLSFINTWALKRLCIRYAGSLIEISWLLLPMTIPFIAAARRFSLRDVAGFAGLAAFSAAFLYYLGQKTALLWLLYPYTGDWVGPHAMFENLPLASSPPTVFGPAVAILLSAIAMVGILCIATIVLFVRPKAIHPLPVDGLTWKQLGVLFAPLTAVYFFLLGPRGVQQIFDRYLLTPIFIAMVCLLLYAQQHFKIRWSAVRYVAVAAIAFYGIITTHNFFAFSRARDLLTKEVFAAGVPPSKIDLGVDLNGWYEILLAGHLNDSRILIPADGYHLIPYRKFSGCQESLFGEFPHQAPVYGLAFDPNVCKGPAPFAAVSYSTWPLRQPTMLYVVRYPTPRRPESDYVDPALPEPGR
jgi:hypothetical protein